MQVAPRAGAWIETKQFQYRLPRRHRVAPRAGAWIETFTQAIYSLIGTTSHPVRVRGLKPRIMITYQARQSESHPVRVRGLKPPVSAPENPPETVAPRAGAWIETKNPALLR
mgnify:CR=1 FL=1